MFDVLPPCFQRTEMPLTGGDFRREGVVVVVVVMGWARGQTEEEGGVTPRANVIYLLALHSPGQKALEVMVPSELPPLQMSIRLPGCAEDGSPWL